MGANATAEPATAARIVSFIIFGVLLIRDRGQIMRALVHCKAIKTDIRSLQLQIQGKTNLVHIRVQFSC